MRNVDVGLIKAAVKEMAMEACIFLSSDVLNKIKEARTIEKSELGCVELDNLIENARLAETLKIPICQDTGMAIVWLEIGQEVHFVGGLLEDSINQGVREAYQEAFLRKSVLNDPLLRVNTGDNTPAIIHYEIVTGSQIRILYSPKGFGSENMSAIRMLNPSDGKAGVVNFVTETVEKAGPNPCPPIVVGVGLGGSFEKAALLSKKSLFRKLGEHNCSPHLEALENELYEAVNKLGIGPQGLGGSSTALAVHVEAYPTHIAGLPVAVNISCHATRHAERII